MKLPTSSPRGRLERFATPLVREGFETALVPASDEIPFDNLLVAIGDEENRYQLELAFIPGMEEQLEGQALLQCFVPIWGSVEPAADADLRQLITILNTQSPLVGFGYLEHERVACFRHVLMLPADEWTADGLVVQTVWMVSYLVELFGAGVKRVAQGASSAPSVLETEPFNQYFH